MSWWNQQTEVKTLTPPYIITENPIDVEWTQPQIPEGETTKQLK